MNLEQCIEYIHSKFRKGSIPGLHRMAELLEMLGNPHRELKYVHIAGTNGKGSTAAMTASILEKAGLRVKVLNIHDAKDPDEFLKKFGPDKFKLLLEGSSNRVEYQLNAIRQKYDLREDDQKIRYVHEAAELICTLDSSITREVYGGRVAESAGISVDAMKMEIGKAYKRSTEAKHSGLEGKIGTGTGLIKAGGQDSTITSVSIFG